MECEAVNPDGTERLRIDQLPRQAAQCGWVADAQRTRPSPGVSTAKGRHERDAEELGNSSGRCAGRAEGEPKDEHVGCGGMANGNENGRRFVGETRIHERREEESGKGSDQANTYGTLGNNDAGRGATVRAGPYNEVWQDADWLYGRDGKWRPVRSGTFPLGHGLPARVVRLRGYGNAIVPQVAQAFIEAFCEAIDELR